MKNKSEKNILTTLINHSNNKICTLSQSQISKLANIPLRTTKWAIKKLEQKGAIAQIRRSNKSPSTYRICSEFLAPPDKILNTVIAPPNLTLNNNLAPPVQRKTPILHHLSEDYTYAKNNQAQEYTEMNKEEAEIRNICNYIYSMLDNNEVYPTGIVFNILSYYLDIILNLITQGLNRFVSTEQIFCEQKNSTEKAKEDSTSFAQIPLKNNSIFDVTHDLLDDYQKAYPFVDVRQTMREIIAWNFSNPSKRKTPRGILRHINGWLKKENKDHNRKENVNERGVPILKHLAKESLIKVPYDYFDDLND
jgi:hypothetical protein